MVVNARLLLYIYIAHFLNKSQKQAPVKTPTLDILLKTIKIPPRTFSPFPSPCCYFFGALKQNKTNWKNNSISSTLFNNSKEVPSLTHRQKNETHVKCTCLCLHFFPLHFISVLLSFSKLLVQPNLIFLPTYDEHYHRSHWIKSHCRQFSSPKNFS